MQLFCYNHLTLTFYFKFTLSLCLKKKINFQLFKKSQVCSTHSHSYPQSLLLSPFSIFLGPCLVLDLCNPLSLRLFPLLGLQDFLDPNVTSHSRPPCPLPYSILSHIVPMIVKDWLSLKCGITKSSCILRNIHNCIQNNNNNNERNKDNLLLIFQ